MAHTAFKEYQAEMALLAPKIAQANGYPAADYRAVIAQLKKKQITGDAILPFYQGRLHEIEQIIVAKKPRHPAVASGHHSSGDCRRDRAAARTSHDNRRLFCIIPGSAASSCCR